MTRTAYRWTPEKIARLCHLREVMKLKWDQIGPRFGISGAACCTKYNSYQSALRIEARRREMPPIAPPPLIPPAIEPAELVPAASDPIARPRYFSDIDRDISLRIARQGLTAGLFGDPPPGRSALDQRRQS